MSTPISITDQGFAELLAHSGWVRQLAGSLLRDDALADDLTQEALLTALAHPPEKGLSARSWLGQVVRNLIRMRFRGERRRQVREAATQAEAEQRDAHLDSPEQLLARVETQRALTGLVVSLEEPFRSTVLLRYYEGLSAAEIAARQHVPAGTVRWRLKTALDKLRAELDRSHGGDRRAWMAVVAPLSLDPAGQGASGAAMGAKLYAALSSKALLAVTFLVALGGTGLLVVQHRAAAPPRAVVRMPPPPELPAVRSAVTEAVRPRLAKQERIELLARLGQARQQSAGTAAGSAGELDKEYIRQQMKALVPLVKECYENALRDRPSLEGKLTVSFTIVAEPDIGGLVADSAIAAEGSTITDSAMRECVQETMYGARFPPPQGGGEVHVTYPFTFSAAGNQ